MSEEWGPWIEHDGKGCPCIGKVVEVVRRSGELLGPFVAYSRRTSPLAMPGNPRHDSWVHLPKSRDVIRYRIRRPRALLDMIDRARKLDTPKLGELETM